MDKTQIKIMNAAMELVISKGYSAMTTKDIAKNAGVNESTLFRRFKGKKDIVVQAMKLEDWNPCLKEEDFIETGDVYIDLVSFAHTYMERVTPKMVQVSIGLRSPDLYDATSLGIMEVPNTLKKVLLRYFSKRLKEGKIGNSNIEGMSMQFISMIFGFVFLKASFEDRLSPLSKDEYIQSSIRIFVQGIQ
ncbi:MAG: TetR/AcrR family transcriptional regulator [Bacillota bacterium]|nr:TetR/AcrR family transcriptional regulator [Bacillota bacterium]